MRLTRDLRLDPCAVFATGFSNGGDMSFLPGTQREPIVAAIARVGGTMMFPLTLNRPACSVLPAQRWERCRQKAMLLRFNMEPQNVGKDKFLYKEDSC